jgi:hypothetical protein
LQCSERCGRFGPLRVLTRDAGFDFKKPNTPYRSVDAMTTDLQMQTLAELLEQCGVGWLLTEHRPDRARTLHLVVERRTTLAASATAAKS